MFVSKVWLAFSVTVILACTPATAATDSGATSSTTISGQAPNGWEMICHVRQFGAETTQFLSAQRPTLVAPNASHASCALKNLRRQPLTISIVSPLACPFKESESGKCARVFATAGAGSFELKAKH